MLRKWIKDLWFGHSAADHASFRQVLNYRHQQIYASTTPQQFDLLRMHIQEDADRFMRILDADLVNEKVSHLFDLINERTDKYKPDYSQYEWLYK